MNALVIGAGVSGLSCAERLGAAGHRVRVVAREGSLETVSATAAAIWFPFEAGDDPRIEGWARATYEELRRMARAGRPGVRMVSGRWLAVADTRDASVCERVPGARRLVGAELPDGFAAAFEMELPVCEMPTYLEGFDVTVERRGLGSLDEAFDLGDVDAVVHCAGLGARELAEDDEVFPIRGQVVRTARGGCERFVICDDAPGGLVYVIPRAGLGDVVLGGTVEPGVDALAPDPAETDSIVARCRDFAPELPELPEGSPRTAAVGLRPARRSSIRLEREVRADGRVVVHDYGHGGSGVTLSWGCADEVVRLLEGGLS